MLLLLWFFRTTLSDYLLACIHLDLPLGRLWLFVLLLDLEKLVRCKERKRDFLIQVLLVSGFRLHKLVLKRCEISLRWDRVWVGSLSLLLRWRILGHFSLHHLLEHLVLDFLVSHVLLHGVRSAFDLCKLCLDVYAVYCFFLFSQFCIVSFLSVVGTCCQKFALDRAALVFQVLFDVAFCGETTTETVGEWVAF